MTDRSDLDELAQRLEETAGLGQQLTQRAHEFAPSSGMDAAWWRERAEALTDLALMLRGAIEPARRRREVRGG